MQHDSNLAIAKFLAVSLVHFSKEYWTPNGTPVFCGGDPAPTTTTESTKDMLAAYTAGLPDYMKVANAQIAPTAEATLAAMQAVSPGLNELQTQLYQAQMPAMAATDREIAAANQMAQAASDVATLTGSGGQLIKTADQLQREIDPEYYATRAAMASALADQLSGKLTGGETEAIQRSVNRNAQAAGMTTPSAERVVAEATTFGDAANSKLSQALAAATGALPAMKSGMDVLQTATGRSSQTPNNAANAFKGTSDTGAQGTVSNAASSMLGSVTDLQKQRNQLESQRLSGIEKANNAMTGVISACCFIFMEAYNGTLPPTVRYWRDRFAPESSERRMGYIKMARWLVPMMQKSRITRWLVNKLMILPMTKFGEWRYGTPGFVYNPINHLINSAWFAFWKFYGKD